ncbi:Solute carrier family 40 protein [Balamuthia mandrillaris]
MSLRALLWQNCRSSWPNGLCLMGNLCGLFSSFVWFVVLIPQLIKNHRRRSTEGLSLIWALCNFTASLFNAPFVFRLDLPLFSKISAVYMPCLEALMLLQFLCYQQHQPQLPLQQGASTTPATRFKLRTLLLFSVFAIVWIASTLAQVMVAEQATPILAWAAVVLWSVETLPQIYLNWQLRSTAAQSSLSVFISFVGKTTDFGAAYLLDMPLQTAVLAFFSSSQNYANVAQVLWFAASSSSIAFASVSVDKEAEDKGERKRDKDEATTLLLSGTSGANGEQPPNEPTPTTSSMEDEIISEEQETVTILSKPLPLPSSLFGRRTTRCDATLLLVGAMMVSCGVVGMAFALAVDVFLSEPLAVSIAVSTLCPSALAAALLLGFLATTRRQHLFFLAGSSCWWTKRNTKGQKEEDEGDEQR